MGKPAVEIAVDDRTGAWSVDGLPMILVPQHFFMNNHRAVEEALGAERLEEVLRPAGHRSAFFWCEREAAHHGLDGPGVFRHYLKRLTQRGWAGFTILRLDAESGTAEIRVDRSPFLDGTARPGKRCGMFASWFEGAMDYASGGRPGRAIGREIACAGEGGRDHCLFEVRPADRADAGVGA